ncbi:MAG: excinuclease ABC subunit UvrA [Planctomycetaceae bacterium]|nr:excinuclease ABC subunit UvrA [Planctomycetaceae bacterium]
MRVRNIELRGVRVHNLKGIDLDVPHHQLIAICGVSGSGKTSLALDTLYAEGQRRYIESFSAYTRQFLDQFEKPVADRIDGMPPAIAVTRAPVSRSSRSTVGTATEIADYLRLLYAKIGQLRCYQCGRPVQAETPESVVSRFADAADGRRLMIAFPYVLSESPPGANWAAELREDGFVRVVVAGQMLSLSAGDTAAALGGPRPDGTEVLVVVDRLVAGPGNRQRAHDSVETAFSKGRGRCAVLREAAPADASGAAAEYRVIDAQRWELWRCSDAWRCETCGIDYPPLEPRSLSFNSPLGACPVCEGFGNILDVDMDLVVPDTSKSLREGAIAPWTTPAYAHELNELLALADDYGIPTDVPFRELSAAHVQLIREGVPERDFGGLNGFFAWLERRKYKMHLRVFLSRWRSYNVCPACHGDRLRPAALAVEVGGQNLGQVSRLEIRAARRFLQQLPLNDWQQRVARLMLQQIDARLGYLEAVGLDYLTLDRTLRTLSGGEAQRVALTSALGSSLVNMLYVLDEPSVGLHPKDVGRLIHAIQDLHRRHNTVVVVEHESALLRAADQLIEIGPAAGERGGEVVFQGTLAEMQASQRSLTGEYLFGRLGVAPPGQRRGTNHGWIRLHGARGNNLKNITVAFPLGVLCVVTGVSGSGKSTLVQDTLYGAICRRKRKNGGKPYPYDELIGDGQIDDVVLVDQSPIGRSPRSNPVTYIKAFDEIRAVFASTIEARTHNYGARHFSFNVEGGRCTACEGDGYKEIDMQFLADIYMKCEQCDGKRYRKEILDVTYRGRNIADVLEMTVREAFTFFRGQTKVQAKLKRLLDVGLEYLRLGQGANTLSTGEAQRLKLASYMSGAKRNRTLFILDEPTTGLHFSDVVRLLDCFDTLLSVGHSLVVVEHNLQLIKAADYLIDLGPGAAGEGGEVVAAGTPEEVAHAGRSATAEFLTDLLTEQT